ncbi:MAG TPA: hypothetical protein PLS10_14240 [Chitinophagales bacterium]|nr:hypothetical protein [Chitinophagales bacterium]
MHKITKPNKKQRLEVYKKALEFIESYTPKGINKYGLTGYDGLCLILPSVFYDQHYLDAIPDGTDWEISDARKLFPEFGKYYPNANYKSNPKYRIKILKEIITKMESQ